jgi:hypothetical protein
VGHKVTNSVNNYGGKSSIGNVVKGIRKSIEGEQDDNASDDTSGWSPDARLGLESSSREGASCWVGVEEGTNEVGHTDGNDFLVGNNLVIVQTSE